MLQGDFPGGDMLAIVEHEFKRVRSSDDVANGCGTTMLATAVEIEKRDARDRNRLGQKAAVWDSSRETCVTAGGHAQLEPCGAQDDELVALQ